MKRQHLYSHRGLALTQDTIEAFKRLEVAADGLGWLVNLVTGPPPTRPPPEGPMSLHPAGRQQIGRAHV